MEKPVSIDNHRVEIRAALESRYADFDLMAASAIGWDQKYDHIGRGHFEGSLSQVVLNTLQVGLECWNPGIMHRGSSPAHCWFIGLPIVAEGSIHVRGQQVESGQPVLVGPCEDIAFVANGRTHLAEALLPVDQIEYWMGIRRGVPGLNKKYLDRPWKMPEREIIRCGNKLVRLLRSLFELNNSHIHPNALVTIEANIIDVVLGMVPSTDVTEPLHRRAKVAMKLRDMLQGSLETPLTVTAMCKSLGVRERTLFLTCLEAFGRPPKTMLLELRLNAVRRALARPSSQQTVTTVAACFGFSHFGNFAAEYKRQFDELPSATLAMGRG